jgi:quercetin dioxygenase-like cupin family protein
MDGFPEFMKSKSNKVTSSQQNTPGTEGYYYEGNDGSQMAFWTCREARKSKKHKHDFDEYMAVVSGEYTLCTNDGERVLKPGDEAFIPKGTEQWGRCAAGTRTIHAFGGRRIKKDV